MAIKYNELKREINERLNWTQTKIQAVFERNEK